MMKNIGNTRFLYLYLSELIGARVVSDDDGRTLGRLTDIAATLGQVYPRVSGLLVKVSGKKPPAYIPWNCIRNSLTERKIRVALPENIGGAYATPTESDILLRKTFLDQQIISTSGFKVVRVNDLQFLQDASNRQNLWLVHIDIGIKGLFRRLGWLPFLNAVFRWIVGRDLKDKFVPWKYVQPTSTTTVLGSLHLKIDSSKLIDIHPADLADIIEELGTDERVTVIESLDPKTAAATLQEIPLKQRIQLAEMLDADRLSPIVNEMEMDEAVDLLDEIAPIHRNAVYALLDPDMVTELKELSKLSVYSVGRIMTTDFLTARSHNTVQQVIESVKAQAQTAELIYYVYVIDEEEHLKGLVTLRELFLEDPGTRVADIMVENVITVEIDTSIKRVAQIFFKYNFDAVPVVDEEDRIQGLISLRDALESVFPEMKEE
jgi:magnesium transporter